MSFQEYLNHRRSQGFSDEFNYRFQLWLISENQLRFRKSLQQWDILWNKFKKETFKETSKNLNKPLNKR